MIFLMIRGDDFKLRRFATRSEAEAAGRACNEGLAYVVERDDDLLGLALNSQEGKTVPVAALVEIYNRYADTPVQRFENRTIGAARVARLLREKCAHLKMEKIVETSVVNGRGKMKKFNRPPLAERKPIRESSKLYQVADLIRGDGRTYQELEQSLGWKYQQIYDALWYLHKNHGFGLVTDDTGRIKLIEA